MWMLVWRLVVGAYQVDGLDLVASNGIHVLLVVADGEDASVHGGVKGLDSA